MPNLNRPPEEIRDELLEHVQFEASRPPNLEWDAGLGFLVDPAGSDEAKVRVAGFAAPYQRKGETPSYDFRSEVYPIDTFSDLPHSLRTIKHLSWGVGLRMYTDEQTARNGSDVSDGGSMVGLYGVDLMRNKILDVRGKQGGPMKHIARYAGKMLLGAVIGTEATVNMVHQGYGDAAAVRLRRPLQGQKSMERAGLTDPEGIEPGFLLLRRRHPAIRRLGYAISSDWI